MKRGCRCGEGEPEHDQQEMAQHPHRDLELGQIACELPIGDAELVELALIRAHAAHDRDHAGVRRYRGVVRIEASRELDTILDRDLLRLIEPAHHIERAHGVPVRRIDRESADPALDLVGDNVHLLGCVSARRRDHDRRPVLDEHAAAKPLRMDERETARHDRDREMCARGASDGEASRTGLQPG